MLPQLLLSTVRAQRDCSAFDGTDAGGASRIPDARGDDKEDVTVAAVVAVTVAVAVAVTVAVAAVTEMREAMTLRSTNLKVIVIVGLILILGLSTNGQAFRDNGEKLVSD